MHLIAAVARKHGINANLEHRWLREHSQRTRARSSVPGSVCGSWPASRKRMRGCEAACFVGTAPGFCPAVRDSGPVILAGKKATLRVASSSRTMRFRVAASKTALPKRTVGWCFAGPSAFKQAHPCDRARRSLPAVLDRWNVRSRLPPPASISVRLPCATPCSPA